MMEKVILTLGMIFAASFMMNANVNNQMNEIVVDSAIEAPLCYDQADAISTAFGALLGLSYEAEFELFEAIYNSCVASGQY